MITPGKSEMRNPNPEIKNAMAHLLYKAAILLLYSVTFFTLHFSVVSPLQKLIGSLLSLL